MTSGHMVCVCEGSFGIKLKEMSLSECGYIIDFVSSLHFWLLAEQGFKKFKQERFMLRKEHYLIFYLKIYSRISYL
jgi:hypothetical protein